MTRLTSYTSLDFSCTLFHPCKAVLEPFHLLAHLLEPLVRLADLARRQVDDPVRQRLDQSWWRIGTWWVSEMAVHLDCL